MEREEKWGEDKRGYKYKKGRKKALKMYHLRYKKKLRGTKPPAKFFVDHFNP